MCLLVISDITDNSDRNSTELSSQKKKANASPTPLDQKVKA